MLGTSFQPLPTEKLNRAKILGGFSPSWVKKKKQPNLKH